MNISEGIFGNWIWICDNPQENEYAVFKENFAYSGENIVLKIAAVNDYIVQINGKIVSFGQFQGYKNEKYYDVIKIEKYCRYGTNELKVTVRYEGVNTLRSVKDKAGVIFNIEGENGVLVRSSIGTLGAKSTEYVQHTRRFITAQIGLSSDMCSPSEEKYRKCVEVDMKDCKLLRRPVEKCSLLAPVKGKNIDEAKNIYDFGAETVGYLHVVFKCKDKCVITAAYGEHIADGEVRRKIEDRDFSLKFHCRKGENDFTQFFVRIGARYVQIISDGSLIAAEVEIIPAVYPVTVKKNIINGIDKKIYDVCVKTLRSCMHEHYEDCPWREQALYVLDGRNQMLCGYYAFKETKFQRENLLFMSKGINPNGLLELTFPAENTPAIPLFSLMYPVAVYEYVRHTGDSEFAALVLDTIKKIMLIFTSRIDKSGLIANFDKPFWNFYEWSKGSDGVYDDASARYDLILNCAYVYAMRHCKMLYNGGECDISFDEGKMKRAIKETFYDAEEEAFYISTANKNIYTELGNAFAALIGLGTKTIYSKLKSKAFVPATLSMRCFVYDALLSYDKNNADYILQDIRTKYGYMLSKGATTFWETIKGENDFNGAGSLCHGWSAMPIYYYHILGIAMPVQE